MHRTSLILVLVAVLVALPVAVMAGENARKVTLCHSDGGSNARTIEVSESAAYGSSQSQAKGAKTQSAGHLGTHEADYLGACVEETVETTPTTQAPAPDLPPVAAFDVSFVRYGFGYQTHMDARASTDPEGQALTYQWTHVGTGSALETSTSIIWDSANLYFSGSSITITLEVFDGTHVASTSRTVVVP